ncbi:MAG: translation initiation factor IF-3 [Myxococcales bacterium]
MQQEERVIARPRFGPRDRPRNFGPRVNDRIRVPEIRVIGADGNMLGVMNTDEARQMARGLDLDLVEVNPKASPPVCKIMDFGRFKYEEKKKQAEARKRQTQIALKEIKLRPKTDEHDLEFKTKHIRRFLEDGNKVKITVRFRGREITHPETAQRQIDAIVEAIQDIGTVETSARLEGRTMTAILAPRVKVQHTR